ncbi:orotidine-5'-phosphate decarboxylase [Demequina litorisediminis]|uniref:Orotidine 5'-phosphate decarboxylase n=1 Tax=Demequina litorisediminis TaxID=1849022 RepID=A0ABQ6IIY3_9MICO|nr:orotidine-5'-phosphate decarboxylase [Demequina litorisediminis]GMA37676.1 orotidine 5'-phosphate decarboxylase [Demequina litorisediminis]
MSFGARLAAAMERHGPLCVGVDPHVSLLTQWGLPDTPDGLAAFSDTVVTGAAGSAAAIKPNAAFYERHGSRGIAVLERLLADARDADLLTVMDAKRGDIGSTMAGYADAFLRPGSPLEADSLTVSPYLGFGSLKPALDLAAETGKGIFVLALTSNPEGHDVQHARTASGEAVAAAVVRQASALNEGATPMGNVGLVVGATVGSAVSDLGIGLDGLNGPILAPGVGAQGAGPDELAQVFGNSRSRVLVNQSRGVLAEGPSLERLRAAVHEASDAAQAALEG